MYIIIQGCSWINEQILIWCDMKKKRPSEQSYTVAIVEITMCLNGWNFTVVLYRDTSFQGMCQYKMLIQYQQLFLSWNFDICNVTADKLQVNNQYNINYLNTLQYYYPIILNIHNIFDSLLHHLSKLLPESLS